MTFVDVASRGGLHFEYFRGDTGKLWTVEPQGGGASAFDFDDDGDSDLFFVNGAQLPLAITDADPSAQLFRNDGLARFEGVTRSARLDLRMYGQGCAAADYDNDGFTDLFATAWKECRLEQNNGDGTFRDVTTAAGCAGGEWNMGATFADFDRDGDLDLYVANYVHFDPTDHAPCKSRDYEVGYCGPSNYQALPSYLYCNLGDGSFADQSEASGIRGENRPAFGSVAANVDGGLWPDLLVAVDGKPKFFFRNVTAPASRISFAESASELGIAVSGNGLPQADMGIACGDYDENGLLDFGISHYYQEHFTLYRNLGERGFLDVTQPVGLDSTTRNKMGWGTGFLDLDYDGWLDLFVVNGHLNNNPGGGTPYAMAAQVFRNHAGERFEDVSADCGAYFKELRVGRGTCVSDLDGDGRQDIVVVHHHQPVALLSNRGPSHHLLVLELLGALSARGGTNVRVWAEFSEPGGAPRRLLRETAAGEGYLGSNDKRLWIGTGQTTTITTLQLEWPSGRVDTFTNVPTDRQYLVVEGRDLHPVRPIQAISDHE